MTNKELIEALNQGEQADSIVLVSEDGIFTIASVEPVDATIIITIQPVVDAEEYKKYLSDTNIKLPNSDTGNSVDIGETLDVFGDLDKVKI
jgi:hypothetical protein